MKSITLLAIINIFYCSISFGQTCEINIIFSLSDKKYDTRKYFDDNGCVHFFIEKEHCEARQPPETIDVKDLNKLTLIDIDRALELSDAKRKSLIEAGEKDGIIKLLPNEEVFDTVFLYEKIQNNKVLRHRAIWVDEIVD